MSRVGLATPYGNRLLLLLGSLKCEKAGNVRIFVFEARGVGLIHAVVRLWLTCWPFKAKGTLST